MGQKVNPIGLRLGINRDWESTWYDEKHFADRLKEDILLRRYITKKYKTASVSKVEITRTSTKVVLIINTARPGLIIGKSGSEVDSLKEELKKLIGYEVVVKVFEIKRPALVAHLVGESIVQQIEKKVNYRRAVKKAIQSSISVGAKGVRIRVAGRLNGAEIARRETFKEGQVPLHTLRAKIDYAHIEANTTYGIIGVKIWIYND